MLLGIIATSIAAVAALSDISNSAAIDAAPKSHPSPAETPAKG